MEKEKLEKCRVKSKFKDFNCSYMGHAMQKCVFGHVQKTKARSGCAPPQSDQDLHCPLTQPLNTTECMNGEQRPAWYFANEQGDPTAYVVHVPRHFFAWHGANNVNHIPCEL